MTPVVAFFLPTGLLTFGIGRLGPASTAGHGRASIQRGLAPVSIGLLFAGAITIARGAVTDLEGRHRRHPACHSAETRINPALLILASAAVGVLLFLMGIGPGAA